MSETRRRAPRRERGGKCQAPRLQPRAAGPLASACREPRAPHGDYDYDAAQDGQAEPLPPHALHLLPLHALPAIPPRTFSRSPPPFNTPCSNVFLSHHPSSDHILPDLRYISAIPPNPPPHPLSTVLPVLHISHILLSLTPNYHHLGVSLPTLHPGHHPPSSRSSSFHLLYSSLLCALSASPLPPSVIPFLTTPPTPYPSSTTLTYSHPNYSNLANSSSSSNSTRTPPLHCSLTRSLLASHITSTSLPLRINIPITSLLYLYLLRITIPLPSSCPQLHSTSPLITLLPTDFIIPLLIPSILTPPNFTKSLSSSNPPSLYPNSLFLPLSYHTLFSILSFSTPIHLFSLSSSYLLLYLSAPPLVYIHPPCVCFLT